MPKAIALLSGGLDSLLAAKIVQDQNVEVIGLHLSSPFGCSEKVGEVAASLGIRLIIKPKGETYLDLVKNPKHGYGKHFNPCIDCRIFMFLLAEEVRREEGADFILTGEVVGQRPLSQRRTAMEFIARKSELEDRVLRPLSAHSFEPTLPEREGWVLRDTFPRISGRGRKLQLELVKQYGLTQYSSPAGGCLLTDAAFSQKARDFFLHEDEENPTRLAEAELLRLGRHFRLSASTKVVLARNHAENVQLSEHWTARQTIGALFCPMDFEGPSAIGFGPLSSEDLQVVGELIVRYAKKVGPHNKIRCHTSERAKDYSVSRALPEAQLLEMRI
jgi:tRNA-uridine 2-sulfurtransferase